LVKLENARLRQKRARQEVKKMEDKKKRLMQMVSAAG
jgi:hypothetical protein